MKPFPLFHTLDDVLSFPTLLAGFLDPVDVFKLTITSWRLYKAVHGRSQRPLLLTSFRLHGWPSFVRAKAWLASLGEGYDRYKPAYTVNQFVDGVDDVGLLGEVDRDLHRTFPQHHMFTLPASLFGPSGHLAPTTLTSALPSDTGPVILRAVLLHFMRSRPDVAYCQGMNYVAAALLVMLEEECDHSRSSQNYDNGGPTRLGALEAERRFQKTCALMLGLSDAYGLADVWRPGLPRLPALANTLSELLRQHTPILHEHLVRIGFSVDVLAAQWLLPLLSTALPFCSLRRVYDLFIATGWKAIFRTLLAVLKRIEHHCVLMDVGEISQLFRMWKDAIGHSDCSASGSDAAKRLLASFPELEVLFTPSELIAAALAVKVTRRHIAAAEEKYAVRVLFSKAAAGLGTSELPPRLFKLGIGPIINQQRPLSARQPLTSPGGLSRKSLVAASQYDGSASSLPTSRTDADDDVVTIPPVVLHPNGVLPESAGSNNANSAAAEAVASAWSAFEMALLAPMSATVPGGHFFERYPAVIAWKVHRARVKQSQMRQGGTALTSSRASWPDSSSATSIASDSRSSRVDQASPRGAGPYSVQQASPGKPSSAVLSPPSSASSSRYLMAPVRLPSLSSPAGARVTSLSSYSYRVGNGTLASAASTAASASLSAAQPKGSQPSSALSVPPQSSAASSATSGGGRSTTAVLGRGILSGGGIGASSNQGRGLLSRGGVPMFPAADNVSSSMSSLPHNRHRHHHLPASVAGGGSSGSAASSRALSALNTSRSGTSDSGSEDDDSSDGDDDSLSRIERDDDVTSGVDSSALLLSSGGRQHLTSSLESLKRRLDFGELLSASGTDSQHRYFPAVAPHRRAMGSVRRTAAPLPLANSVAPPTSSTPAIVPRLQLTSSSPPPPPAPEPAWWEQLPVAQPRYLCDSRLDCGELFYSLLHALAQDIASIDGVTAQDVAVLTAKAASAKAAVTSAQEAWKKAKLLLEAEEVRVGQSLEKSRAARSAVHSLLTGIAVAATTTTATAGNAGASPSPAAAAAKAIATLPAKLAAHALGASTAPGVVASPAMVKRASALLSTVDARVHEVSASWKRMVWESTLCLTRLEELTAAEASLQHQLVEFIAEREGEKTELAKRLWRALTALWLRERAAAAAAVGGGGQYASPADEGI